MLSYGVPPDLRDGVHISTVNHHRFSVKFIGSRNCVVITFSAENPLAQGSSNNDYCLSSIQLSFPTPTFGMCGSMCDTESPGGGMEGADK